MEWIKKIDRVVTNYLDDFLFVHYLRRVCNELLEAFLQICQQIRFPVALDKTFVAAEVVEFLGVLLDGRRLMICIPQDKVNKAFHLMSKVVFHKKIKVKTLQQLTGTLNFLSCAIVLG